MLRPPAARPAIGPALLSVVGMVHAAFPLWRIWQAVAASRFVPRGEREQVPAVRSLGGSSRIASDDHARAGGDAGVTGCRVGIEAARAG